MAQIQDEFLFIASHALRQRPGIETLRVRAVQPSRNGPIVAYVRGPIGPPPDTNFGRPYGEAPPDAVLEGVMRVLQVRWRGGPPVAMRFDDEAWRAPLHRVYPGTFESGGPHSWAGWRFIWLAAAEWIEEIGKPDDWECGQTKEKFGSLRWYVYGSLASRHKNVIRTMEIISGHTCEYCGAPGRLRKGGWAKVSCDAHAQGKEAVSYDD
jgi:hypothetical protein